MEQDFPFGPVPNKRDLLHRIDFIESDMHAALEKLQIMHREMLYIKKIYGPYLQNLTDE